MRFFSRSQSPGLSGSVMAASVFAAGVAALAVLVVVVAAMNVGVILKNVVYEGGCNGGTQGIGAMSEGRPAVEVADILIHVICDLKKSGSSCGQQLVFGIRQALMIINGTACASTQDAFSALCKGKTIDYCVERMSGILCHGFKGSSCPDQTAEALAQAKVVITGEGCANCGEAK